jgi:DNA-binding NarL/FixJ family response regulator
MILCVVDDMLFASKISTAARALQREIVYERAADRVLPRVRELRPALVIFDLNGTKMRPMEAIAAIKADPDLAPTRTLGYVSHVQGDVIAAARAAGIDDVLARSAFSERLAEILSKEGV